MKNAKDTKDGATESSFVFFVRFVFFMPFVDFVFVRHRRHGCAGKAAGWVRPSACAVFWNTLACLFLLSATQTAAQTIAGRVTAVHDGDTISIRTAHDTVRVRLVGIDCPEAGQPFAARAKRFTAEHAFGRDVIVRGQGEDQYDRLLGRVLVDGRDLNEALVRAGLAWQYDPASARQGPLAAAERNARAERRGLWSDADPVPPWHWRRAHPRTDRQEQRPGRDNARTTAEDSGPAGPLRGNTRSRVFHRPGCRNYTCRNCTEQFLTEASALEAGYRQAGDCRRQRRH